MKDDIKLTGNTVLSGKGRAFSCPPVFLREQEATRLPNELRAVELGCSPAKPAPVLLLLLPDCSAE